MVSYYVSNVSHIRKYRSVNSPHKGPVTRKLCSLDDVIMMFQPARPFVTGTYSPFLRLYQLMKPIATARLRFLVDSLSKPPLDGVAFGAWGRLGGTPKSGTNENFCARIIYLGQEEEIHHTDTVEYNYMPYITASGVDICSVLTPPPPTHTHTHTHPPTPHPHPTHTPSPTPHPTHTPHTPTHPHTSAKMVTISHATCSWLGTEYATSRILRQCSPDSLTHICGTRGRCVSVETVYRV